MKGICMLISLLLLTLLVGCTPPVNSITGSGRIVTREESVSGFDEVEVSHAFEVKILQGERYRVIVRIDDNLLDELMVQKQGSSLKIGLQPNRPFTVRRFTGEAEVTMPELVGLELSGACQGTVTGLSSREPLWVNVSGASQLRGDIEAGDARFDVSGASQMTLSGSGYDLAVDASGASVVDLSDFSVLDADIQASGASKVTVDSSGTLDVDASGASLVTALGNPTMGRIELSGSSSVKER